MYRLLLILMLVVVSAMPALARGVAGHGTMHRLGSNLRHHHAEQRPAVANADSATRADTTR